MTRTEILLGMLVLAAVILLSFGWWWTLLIGVIIVIIFLSSMHQMDNDPPHMGILTFFGRPTHGFIRRPRFALTFGYFPIVEEVMSVTTEPFNWDFTFDDVNCNLVDTTLDASNFEFVPGGGSVKVRISYTGGVVQDADHAFDFVRQGRASGVHDKFEDRLEKLVRKHGTYTSAWKFVGEKEPFGVKANGWLNELVKDLGLERGQLDVKDIEPLGDLKKVIASRAVEVQQRESEKLNTETANQNAAAILKAAREAGDTTMTFAEALENDRIQRGITKETRINARGNASGRIVPAVIGRELMDNNQNQAGDDDGDGADNQH